jgi:glycosyltransferase involved in cell wall biosynthesis
VKVLAIASSGVLGGSELALSQLLIDRPPEVEMVTLLMEDGPLRDHLAQRGVPTWTASGFTGRPSAGALTRYTRSMLALLRRTDPDVVLAVGLKAAYMSVPACRIARVPLVWYKVDFSLDEKLARPLGRAVNGVVSVSGAVADALGPLRARKLLAVVPTPVRLPRELRITPVRQPPTIGTLASLTPFKGQRHIIEAAALLSEEFPDLRVVLAGLGTSKNPTYPEELRRLADSVGLGDRLELSGFVEDVSEVLGRLTVFVNATYRDGRGFGGEGLGNATLEAGWAGLPVVATRGGGSPEAMQDGLTGTLVEPSDPDDLARGIAPYLRDHDLARRTGEAGRRFARERFAPEIVVPRMFEALGGLLEPASGARARRKAAAHHADHEGDVPRTDKPVDREQDGQVREQTRRQRRRQAVVQRYGYRGHRQAPGERSDRRL